MSTKINRYKKSGWFNESQRHSLASKGIKTKINKILYNPMKSQVDKELLTIEVPKKKSKHLGFLKAYTKFNTKGVWKNIDDDNVQIEIEFKDSKDERYGNELMSLFKELNKKDIKEDVLYVRTEPIEESSLDYARVNLKGVKPKISTASGEAYYIGTEIEDKNGNWNDNYYIKDGYWVIHQGDRHHVYKSKKNEVYQKEPEVCLTDQQIYEERYGHYYDDV